MQMWEHLYEYPGEMEGGRTQYSLSGNSAAAANPFTNNRNHGALQHNVSSQ